MFGPALRASRRSRRVAHGGARLRTPLHCRSLTRRANTRRFMAVQAPTFPLITSCKTLASYA